MITGVGLSGVQGGADHPMSNILFDPAMKTQLNGQNNMNIEHHQTYVSTPIYF